MGASKDAMPPLDNSARRLYSACGLAAGREPENQT
jgi:hypothetical protein